MALVNAGNAVGLIKSETAPSKLYVIWAHQFNPGDLDQVILKVYDFDISDWVSISTSATLQWTTLEW